MRTHSKTMFFGRRLYSMNRKLMVGTRFCHRSEFETFGYINFTLVRGNIIIFARNLYYGCGGTFFTHTPTLCTHYYYGHIYHCLASKFHTPYDSFRRKLERKLFDWDSYMSRGKSLINCVADAVYVFVCVFREFAANLRTRNWKRRNAVA